MKIHVGKGERKKGRGERWRNRKGGMKESGGGTGRESYGERGCGESDGAREKGRVKCD